MKNILMILMLFMSFGIFGQLPYTWTTGVNPGWISTNYGLGNSLNWNSGCSVVTTNCTGNYSNNQNTFYTSPTINASCNNASSINITFSASGNAESGYDFLFIEYSLDNGITWINPYGINVGWTGSFGAGSTIPVINVPTSPTFKFRFNFYSDFSNRASGYKITDFDIWCNVVLPIELIYFNGVRYSCSQNILNWATATETNNDHFEIERSADAINFKTIKEISGSIYSTDTKKYIYVDSNPESGINYYRLKQVDLDGTYKYAPIIDIDNSCAKNLKILKITNLLGQEVNEEYGGPKIFYYNYGSILKSL